MNTVMETSEKEIDIDFLPAHYREKTEQLKGRAWRLSTIVLVVLLLPAVSIYQLRLRSQLKGELKAVSAQCASVDSYRAQLQTLEFQRQQLEAQARLIAYLHFPWPRSQVVSDLIGPLPQSLTLTSLQIEEISASAVATPTQARNPHQETQKQELQLPPADADLKALREKHDRAYVTVLITGLTTDPSQLHEYLGQISRAPLFTKAELLSLESPSSKLAPRAGEGAQFRAQIYVAPGLGQPGGPQPASPNEPKATSVAGRLP